MEPIGAHQAGRSWVRSLSESLDDYFGAEGSVFGFLGVVG
jgi:hypothetical protein